MEVILIRHGVAEEHSQAKPDDKRELTKKGIERLNALFPIINKQLSSNSMTRIWTSPLTRAVQTAALLCDHLNINDFEKYPFIATGETSAFLQAIYAQDVRSRLILVGHEPILSHWTKQLTGQSITFTKGMILSIEVADAQPRLGTINYSLDPKKELR